MQVQAIRHVSVYGQAVSRVTLCLVEGGFCCPGVWSTRHVQDRQVLQFSIVAGTVQGFRAVSLSTQSLENTPQYLLAVRKPNG